MKRICKRNDKSRRRWILRNASNKNERERERKGKGRNREWTWMRNQGGRTTGRREEKMTEGGWER